VMAWPPPQGAVCRSIVVARVGRDIRKVDRSAFEGLSGAPYIPKKARGAQSRVGSVGLGAPSFLSTPSARDRDLLGVPFGLPGVPCIPKKERGGHSLVGSGSHGAPRRLSEPSARDRGPLGVPFASSRLPPGGSGRRPHERFVRQEPYGRRLSRARAAGIRRLARQRSGRGVRRGGVPGRPHERCRRRPSGWPQETCWITPSTRPREPPWHSGRIR